MAILKIMKPSKNSKCKLFEKLNPLIFIMSKLYGYNVLTYNSSFSNNMHKLWSCKKMSADMILV